MGVAFYWESHYGDTQTEEALRQDPKETQPVWGLACDRTGCVFSDFGEPLSKDYRRIYSSLVAGMMARTWRFPTFYAEVSGEEFCWPTLIIRRNVRDLASRFPSIEGAVFDFATDPARTGDYDLINGLDDQLLTNLVGPPSFEQRAAYDYHRFTALAQVIRDRELRPTIHVVEDVARPQFWSEVSKRMISAGELLPIEQGPGEYTLTGSRGQQCHVNVTTITCTCEDFQRRGRLYGFHCKHLVACLRDAGLWHLWKADLPPYLTTPSSQTDDES